jgi:hypothetical protein
MYPGYDEAHKKDAQSVISDYLQSNPAFAKQVVSAGISATSEFAVKNPGKLTYFLHKFNLIGILIIDLVKQGAGAYLNNNF